MSRAQGRTRLNIVQRLCPSPALHRRAAAAAGAPASHLYTHLCSPTSTLITNPLHSFSPLLSPPTYQHLAGCGPVQVAALTAARQQATGPGPQSWPALAARLGLSLPSSLPFLEFLPPTCVAGAGPPDFAASPPCLLLTSCLCRLPCRHAAIAG